MLYAALVVVELCSAAASQRGQRTSYDYYQQNEHPDYSYSQVEQYDVGVDVEAWKCYSCEYTVLSKQNIEEGSKECMDPFTGVGVKEIECSGPCSVRYSSLA